jgi:hypothetical protein
VARKDAAPALQRCPQACAHAPDGATAARHAQQRSVFPTGRCRHRQCPHDGGATSPEPVQTGELCGLPDRQLGARGTGSTCVAHAHHMSAAAHRNPSVRAVVASSKEMEEADQELWRSERSVELGRGIPRKAGGHGRGRGCAWPGPSLPNATITCLIASFRGLCSQIQRWKQRGLESGCPVRHQKTCAADLSGSSVRIHTSAARAPRRNVRQGDAKRCGYSIVPGCRPYRPDTVRTAVSTGNVRTTFCLRRSRATGLSLAHC